MRHIHHELLQSLWLQLQFLFRAEKRIAGTLTSLKHPSFSGPFPTCLHHIHPAHSLSELGIFSRTSKPGFCASFMHI